MDHHCVDCSCRISSQIFRSFYFSTRRSLSRYYGHQGFEGRAFFYSILISLSILGEFTTILNSYFFYSFPSFFTSFPSFPAFSPCPFSLKFFINPMIAFSFSSMASFNSKISCSFSQTSPSLLERLLMSTKFSFLESFTFFSRAEILYRQKRSCLCRAGEARGMLERWHSMESYENLRMSWSRVEMASSYQRREGSVFWEERRAFI